MRMSYMRACNKMLQHEHGVCTDLRDGVSSLVCHQFMHILVALHSGMHGYEDAFQSRGRPIFSIEIGDRNSWKWYHHFEQGQANLCRAGIFPTRANYQGLGNSLPGQNLSDPLLDPSKSIDFRPALIRVGRDSAKTGDPWRRSGFR